MFTFSRSAIFAFFGTFLKKMLHVLCNCVFRLSVFTLPSVVCSISPLFKMPFWLVPLVLSVASSVFTWFSSLRRNKIKGLISILVILLSVFAYQGLVFDKSRRDSSSISSFLISSRSSSVPSSSLTTTKFYVHFFNFKYGQGH